MAAQTLRRMIAATTPSDEPQIVTLPHRGRYIKAPNAASYDGFGSALALSGDTLAVGAEHEDSCTTSVTTAAATDNSCRDAGAVYVFARIGVTWSFQAYGRTESKDADRGRHAVG